MKKYILSIFTIALFAVGFVASDEEESANNTNKEQKQETKEKVEEKEKEVAVEKKEDAVEKKENSIFGTYEVTDKTGRTIQITLNEDETAIVKDEQFTYYASLLTHPTAGIIIRFSEEGKPSLIYEGGRDKYTMGVLYLKNGWLYTGGENASANNPKWRLKATKIK